MKIICTIPTKLSEKQRFDIVSNLKDCVEVKYNPELKENFPRIKTHNLEIQFLNEKKVNIIADLSPHEFKFAMNVLHPFFEKNISERMHLYPTASEFFEIEKPQSYREVDFDRIPFNIFKLQKILWKLIIQSAGLTPQEIKKELTERMKKCEDKNELTYLKILNKLL